MIDRLLRGHRLRVCCAAGFFPRPPHAIQAFIDGMPLPAAARACPACHTPLPIEAHFCLHCGTPTPTEPGVPARTAPTGAVEISRVQAALIGSYRVERVLGEGGMATVYLAEDVKHKRKVAVKVMRPELAETLGTERFLREVEIAAQLSHPSILPVFDSGSTNGVLWYVMPYVEGESLPEWIRRERQLAVGDAVRLAREVAEALAYAHERGIVHRDIKPANILLHSGRALVADFGIARAAGTDGASLTKTGLAIGTPQYMSPEQSSGDRDVDGRADVYALGCVLYEMIAGEPPFTGPTMQAVVARSLTERPRPLTATREGLPSKLNAVVDRALAKSPADRYPSATAMAGALAGVEAQLHGGSGEITPLAPASAGRVWLVFGIAALLALTALVVLAVRKGLPPWVVGLAGVLIGGGALALTLTARAEHRRRDGAMSGRFDHWLNWRNAALGGVAALAVWAMTATAFAVSGPTSAGTDSKRLAILPFENQGKADDAYLADGIVDEVRGKLTKLGQLSVIASTSTNQYRGTSKTPQADRPGAGRRLPAGRQGALGGRPRFGAQGASGRRAGGRSDGSHDLAAGVRCRRHRRVQHADGDGDPRGRRAGRRTRQQRAAATGDAPDHQCRGVRPLPQGPRDHEQQRRSPARGGRVLRTGRGPRFDVHGRMGVAHPRACPGVQQRHP